MSGGIVGISSKSGPDEQVRKDLKEIKEGRKSDKKTNRNYLIIAVACSSVFFILGLLLR